MHHLGAPGTKSEAVSGPVQFQGRAHEAIVTGSICVGATRCDRFDSLPGSIGMRCTCRRVPP
eukprot:1402618-Alexandrium_andersonii.AAC.1